MVGCCAPENLEIPGRGFRRAQNDSLGSRGIPMSGDDLVCGTARDLSHVIKLSRKTAGAGSCRAQFYDQLADLGEHHDPTYSNSAW